MDFSFNSTTNDVVPPLKGFLPGTPIVFDSFIPIYKRKVSFYILTHFHADHYAGLHDNWNDGRIFCSILTRKFILQKWNINPSLVIGLEKNKIHSIPFCKDNSNTNCNEYCTMELFDANHCPGSSMFLIKGYFGSIFLTGDFRNSKSVMNKLKDKGITNEVIDYLIIDCTFSDDFWIFPKQLHAINQIINLIDNNINSQVYIESEMLGLEPILLLIARKYKTKIHVDNKKWKQCSVLPELQKYFTLSEEESKFHVCPHKTFSSLQLKGEKNIKLNYMEVSRKSSTTPKDSSNLFIKPSTMWFGMSRNKILNLIPYQNKPAKAKDSWHILYSIHSSYNELIEFVKFMNVRKIIPSTECNSETLKLFNQYTHKSQMNLITIPYNLYCLYPSLSRQCGDNIKIEEKQINDNKSIRNDNDNNINNDNILTCWSPSPPTSPEINDDCIILEEYNYNKPKIGRKREKIINAQPKIKKQRIGW